MTETGKNLWDQAQHRAFKKDLGLQRAISRKLQPVSVFTSTNLWVRNGMTIELDHARLSKVVASIIRGLFRFETGEIIDYQTCVEAAPLLTEAAVANVTELVKETIRGKRDWPGTFEYRRGICNEVQQGSIWFLRFFGQICYWGITSPATIPVAAHREDSGQSIL